MGFDSTKVTSLPDEVHHKCDYFENLYHIHNVVSKLASQNVWQSSHSNIERFYTREPVRRPSSKLLHQAIWPSANGYAKLTDLCLAAELIKGITSTFANIAAKYGYEEETDRHSVSRRSGPPYSSTRSRNFTLLAQARRTCQRPRGDNNVIGIACGFMKQSPQERPHLHFGCRNFLTAEYHVWFDELNWILKTD